MFLLNWIGIFDALKCFQQLAKTLHHSAAHEFILVLQVSRDHSEDVTYQVSIVEGLYHLGELGCTFQVEKAGQKVQVAIELLDPLHKLPDWNSIWLLQPIACVEALGLGCVTPEDRE